MTNLPARAEYTPIIDRPDLQWPNEARIAVFVALNVEYYEPGEPAVGVLDAVANRDPDPINHGWREYGPRVGIWRIIDMLDRHGIPVSALLNSDVCDAYPQIIQAGKDRNWCWVAHGKNNSMFAGSDAPSLAPDEERALLSDILATIEQSTGRRPHGWLGPLGLSQTPNTLELLADLGLDYVLDSADDDQPHRIATTQNAILSMPYSFEVNDLPLFLRNGASGPDLARTIIDQFDVLYAESSSIPRVMAIALHPFVAGQPFRHKHIDRALAHIVNHNDVWLTTTDQIADHYRQQASENPN